MPHLRMELVGRNWILYGAQGETLLSARSRPVRLDDLYIDDPAAVQVHAEMARLQASGGCAAATSEWNFDGLVQPRPCPCLATDGRYCGLHGGDDK